MKYSRPSNVTYNTREFSWISTVFATLRSNYFEGAYKYGHTGTQYATNVPRRDVYVAYLVEQPWNILFGKISCRIDRSSSPEAMSLSLTKRVNDDVFDVLL